MIVRNSTVLLLLLLLLLPQGGIDLQYLTNWYLKTPFSLAVLAEMVYSLLTGYILVLDNWASEVVPSVPP